MTRSIAELIQEPESKTLEFKQGLASPRPWLRTLVAFSNSAGGRLIFGVANDRHIIGIDQPLDEEERLCNLIADSIAPRLVPNVEMTTVEGKTLLMVEVFLSGSRPHFLKTEGMQQGVYVRLGSTNRQADSHLIAELQRGVSGVSFDGQPMPHLSKSDLNLAAIQDDFGEKSGSDNVLQSLKLLTKEQGKLVPTNGAILLYGKDRRFHFDDAWIQCGRFIGNDKSDIFDHIDIEAPFPKAVDDIMLFLKKHAMRGADFSEIRRKDLWSIPIDILREVVVNALVHADYSQRGSPIRVAFFDNRIEVESPGLLLPGLTVEDMKLGISKIRNPIIARVFKELDLIEQWGSGIPGIFRKIEEQHLPEATIEEIGMRVRFTVYLKPVVPLTAEQSRSGQAPAGTELGRLSELREASEQVDEQVDEQVSEQVMIILQACKTHPRSKAELLNALGLANVYMNYKRHLHPLLDHEILERTIPDKPNSRLQKYRLTNKGQRLLYEGNTGLDVLDE